MKSIVHLQMKSISINNLGHYVAEAVSEGEMPLKHCGITITAFVLAMVFVIPLAGCKGGSDKPGKASIKMFRSPDDASNALLIAAKSGDQNALTEIFGPDSKNVLFSGDTVQDKQTADLFMAGYEVMHRWRKMQDGGQILLVGADNFPFPIPLKKSSDGNWFFETAAGKDEVLNRRIGKNELAIIEVCEVAADAQAEYFADLHDGEKTKQYAEKFISDPGKQNGLYWKSVEGEPASPLGPLAALASSEGYNAKPDRHTAFHGYYFHMLKEQSDKTPGGAKNYVVNGKMTGGFAFVAYPAQYANSGMMTFIINQDGVLLEKDLGKTTTEVATAMTEFDPDPGWRIVEQ